MKIKSWYQRVWWIHLIATFLLVSPFWLCPESGDGLRCVSLLMVISRPISLSVSHALCTATLTTRAGCNTSIQVTPRHKTRSDADITVTKYFCILHQMFFIPSYQVPSLVWYISKATISENSSQNHQFAKGKYFWVIAKYIPGKTQNIFMSGITLKN